MENNKNVEFYDLYKKYYNEVYLLNVLLKSGKDDAKISLENLKSARQKAKIAEINNIYFKSIKDFDVMKLNFGLGLLADLIQSKLNLSNKSKIDKDFDKEVLKGELFELLINNELYTPYKYLDYNFCEQLFIALSNFEDNYLSKEKLYKNIMIIYNIFKKLKLDLDIGSININDIYQLDSFKNYYFDNNKALNYYRNNVGIYRKKR